MITETLEKESNTVTVDSAIKIAVAKGDVIGPEIMDATLKVLKAAGANIEPEYIEIGE
tara:strand:- start:6956 stop:7129 length:174 start_codon:yes stop_codon:yes gene_type:complete